jgi:hypothetical protein
MRVEKINLGRVILGGLLAGLVLNVGEAILNTAVIAGPLEAALQARNLPAIGGEAIAGFVVLAFALGIALVWVYAAIRTRFGPGIPTAVVAGVMVWFLAYLYPNVVTVIMGVFPGDIIAIASVWGLVEIVLASIAGAWVYTE